MAAFVAMTACGGDSGNSGGDQQDGGTIRPPLPFISSVRVEGRDLPQIRQGIGGEPTNFATEVYLEGALLAGATRVTVGDIEGTIRANTENSLTFRILVPHGARLGLQPVTVTNGRGTGTLAQGITITPITAAPSGLDATGMGTDEKPYRSLSAAMSVAGAGDTILLKNGTYDQQHGDAFATPFEPNVRAGVTIKGEGAGATKLIGTGKVKCNDPTARVGLVLGADTRIESVELSNFCLGVYATTGNATLSAVSVHDNGSDGIQINGSSNVSLDTVDVHGNAATGVSIRDSATASVSGGRIFANGDFGIVSTGSMLTVSKTEIDSHFRDNAPYPPAGTGIRVTSPKFILTGSNIHGNAVGISLEGGSSSATVTDCTLENNYGIFIVGKWSLKVRGTTLRGNTHLYLNELDGTTAVDLGTGIDPGKNTFDIPIAGTAIDNRRRDSLGTKLLAPVYIAGNTWIGTPAPPAGCSTAAYNPPYNGGDPNARYNWYIQTPGICSSTGNVIIN
ncbi:right-handed parallel beta-helix repeat-containing protein [Pendulispora brunnea]|uniref:Right-handed parallel beta-helix repeat-containing protein n=1 Tax=Pendulispora brunnea TaxID=2905690 RepID=A0ABZ2KKC8_9BACT